MFIFATDLELWTCNLIGTFFSRNDILFGRKDILKFIYYFMILFLIVYIFNFFYC
jgi:hypothetical protein